MSTIIQQQLFTQQRTWLHYVGKQYSIKKFISEANSIGISRRVSPSVARGMAFGDRVTFCRWKEGDNDGAAAFADGVIVGITLDEETARYVAEAFGAEIKDAIANGNTSTSIERVCGEYVEVFTIHVNASLKEVASAAIEKAEAEGHKPFIMIKCKLVETYTPRPLPGVKFTRGFINHEANYPAFNQHTPDQQVTGIKGYKRN